MNGAAGEQVEDRDHAHGGNSTPGQEMSDAVIGWDIGGVNIKVARVAGGRVLAARSFPFELQRDPGRLADLLRELGAAVGADDQGPHALTMTAELSQYFRTKREGVGFVLDAAERAFPRASVHVYAVDGHFVAPNVARAEPLRVAASNWAAAAAMVSSHWRDAVFVDIGTTSTDIIPIRDGVVAALGRMDPERLRAGELVYTGAVRTPVEAVVHEVPLDGGLAGVSAEGFALVGDVHLWRGDLAPADYTVPTPDGRPAAREFAGERLARVVCADREILDDAAIDRIADHVAEAQVERIACALGRVLERHPAADLAVISGLGAFIAERAAHRAGIASVNLANALGADASRSAPAAAVALLLERVLAR
jgi:probable H4MPT-linked C1 transfer pathway protein